MSSPVAQAQPLSAAPQSAKREVVSSRPDVISARTTAKAQGSRVEVDALRSETSSTYVNPDGTMTVEQYGGAIRYKDAAGAWQDVDLTPVVAGDGSLVVKDRATPTRLGKATSAGTSDLITMDAGKDSKSNARRFAWQHGGKLPAPVVENGQAVYRDVTPGVDVRIQPLREGFEQFFVLRSRPQGRTSWTVPLSIPGLTPREDADGGISFLSDGKVVSRLLPALAWDATVDPRSGDPANTSPVALHVTALGKGSARLTITPNQAWLNAPERTFPVTVDPTYLQSTRTPNFDTYVQSDTSSDQSASTELRIGTYDGSTKARSFLNFDTGNIRGRSIMSAKLRMYEFHSFSCTASTVYAQSTDAPASTATRWSAQPGVTGTLTTASFAQGYSSSCPAGIVEIPITQQVQAWSTSSATTQGLRLWASETSTSGWKKFYSANTGYIPVIVFTFDTKPNVAGTPTVNWTADWTDPDTQQTLPYVSSAWPIFGTTTSDRDGDALTYTMVVYDDAATTHEVARCVTGANASGAAVTYHSYSNTLVGPGWCRLPWASPLSTGQHYWVKAATYDGYLWNGTWSPTREFIVASTTPPAPAITCSQANNSWATTPPAQDVSCTVQAPAGYSPAGADRPVRVLVSLDGSPERSYPVTGPTLTASFTLSKTPGQHSISARYQSPSTYTSTAASWGFGYGAGLTSPTDHATSNDSFPLAAGVPAPAGLVDGSGYTAQLQVRRPGDTTWTDAKLSTVSGTVSHAGAAFRDVIWHAAGEFGDGSGFLFSPTDARTPQLIEAQVCFTFTPTDTTCTWTTSPLTVLRVPKAFGAGYPTTSAGPAQLALYTGEVAVSSTDVSVPGYTSALSVSRSFTTFDGPIDGVHNVFGPGWSAGFDGPDSGSADLRVVDDTANSGAMYLLDDEGSALAFMQPGGGHVPQQPGDYTPLDNDTRLDGSTLHVNAATGGTITLTLTEADGTVTTFSRAATGTGTGTVWAPAGVAEPTGSVNQPGPATSYARDAQGRITRITTAPSDATISCPATGTPAKGCRVLEFGYAATTTATTTVPGNIAGQLAQVSLLIWDPTTAAVTSTPVAQYSYLALPGRSDGLLASATDPRSGLGVSYTYTGTAGSQTDPLKIASITPAGLKAYRFRYDAMSRLTTLSRDPLSGSTPVRQATYVYDIDSGTSGDLPQLWGTATWDGWRQASAPVKAFAVFGPDCGEVPTTAGSITGTTWRCADLQYTDTLGYAVNTATFGAGAWQPTATEYTADGNVQRSWDAGGLAAAREASDHGLTPEMADLYATVTRYNSEYTVNGATVPAGAHVTDTWEPVRDVVFADGIARPGRPHTHTAYDEGAPNSGINPVTQQPYQLPTSSVSGIASAEIAPLTQAVPADLEVAAKSTISYDAPVAGDPDTWALGLPTVQTVINPANPTQTQATTTRYDALGRVIETRLPGSTGSDAATTKTVYYRSGTGSGDAACDGHQEWAGLVCRTYPAAAPNAGPTMPDKRVTAYSALLSPATVVETSGTGGSPATRTTTMTYLPDGRAETTSVTAANLPGSVTQPATKLTYDSVTGLLIKTASMSGTTELSSVQTGYDAWGRTVSTTNAQGEATTTAYVPFGVNGAPQVGAGQVASVTDTKGTVSYGYGNDANGAEERRGMPTSLTVSDAGTFTAAYDADGKLTSQQLPGGLRQTTTYDTAGEPIGLSYGTSTAPEGTWLAWSQANDVLGRVRREFTPEGSAFDDNAAAYDRKYGYDAFGRMTTVTDVTDTAGDGTDELLTTACTTRTYTFDARGNRTSLTGFAAAADNSCQTTTPATTRTWSYDSADRTSSTGYTYDAFGRTLTIPAVDNPSGSAAGNISITYYDTDLAATVTGGGNKTTYTLDPLGRRLNATVAPAAGGAATSGLVRHYTDAGDNPGWVQDTVTGTTTRYAESLGGDLGIQLVTQGGASTVKVMLANLHGDSVSSVTLPTTGVPVGLDAWSDYTEYGASRAAASTAVVAGQAGYGWLGAKQRSTEASGLVLMGVRLYNAATGRFSSVDSVAHANENAYNYPNDPVNMVDLDGRAPLKGAEAKRCARHPNQCRKYLWIGLTVMIATGGMDFTRYNDAQANAFRHIMWSSLLVYYLGKSDALKWQTAHEDGETGADTKIDRRNNALGNAVGERLRKAFRGAPEHAVIAAAWAAAKALVDAGKYAS